jgi:hypothetical protein
MRVGTGTLQLIARQIAEVDRPLDGGTVARIKAER